MGVFVSAILVGFAFLRCVCHGKSLVQRPNSGTIATDTSVCYSECFFNIDELCEYGEKTYDDLDKWHTDDCLECTCYGGIGVMCCNKVCYPVDWPSHCMPVLQRNQCKIKLVEKADGKEECNWRSWASKMEKRR